MEVHFSVSNNVFGSSKRITSVSLSNEDVINFEAPRSHYWHGFYKIVYTRLGNGSPGVG